MADRAGAGLHVVVDALHNTLRLMIPGAGPDHASELTTPESIVSSQAILDVGEAGRLLGLEITSGRHGEAEPWFLDLEDAPGDQLRSVQVIVSVARTAGGDPIWVDLPRRGDGYELTFPVGNQCWVRPRNRG